MRGMREFGNALMAAFLSVGLTLGALSISLVGFVPEDSTPPAPALILSPVPVTATNTFPPTLTSVVVNTLTATATITFIPPTSCQPPAGWIPISIQAGDTLDSIASRYRTSKDLLKNGNCLVIESLIPGKVIYVPPAPTSTPVICVPGASNWIKSHIVRSGDTFYNIAARYGTNANLIKNVNCRNSDLIYPGEVLWVPNVPTRTPTFTPLPGITFTAAPLLTEPFTQTVLPFTLTPTLTQTPVPPTATPIPTQSASPTAFPTPTSTP